MRAKTLWDGEWVKIAVLMNRRFVPTDPRCEVCLRVSCAPAWFSIKTKRVRCLACFTPESYK